MEANQYFSAPRFGHLLRRELSQNKKSALMVAAVMFLILCINCLSWGYSRNDGFHELFYPLFLLIGGFILTSLSFSEMNHSIGRLFYLSLPASNLEKFASKWLITGLGYGIGFTVGYWLFSIIGNSLNHLFFNNNFEAFNPFTKENGLFFSVYLAVQTIFLLGAVYFRKYEIFKTVLTGVLVVLGMLLLSAFLFRIVMFDLFDGLQFEPDLNINGKMTPVEPSKSFQRFMQQNAVGYLKLVGLWIIPTVLLIIGYFKLKETEL